MLKRLFGRATGRSHPLNPAQALYAAVVRQARQPEFYGEGRVSDTVEGRFELLALHGFLVLHRLKREGDATRSLAQGMFDTMFEDLDRNLREIGIGDLGVGKRIKLLAENFYGRIKVYEEGLRGAPGVLETAITRNLLTDTAATPASPGAASSSVARVIADYVRREASALAVQPLRSLAAGELRFGPAPSFTGVAS